MRIFPARDSGRRGFEGDEELAVALYQEYYSPLLGFTRRLTHGDRQWAEDVVQETLLRAWRNAHQLNGHAESLMPWLATVARRIVISDTRKRDARPKEIGDKPLNNVPAGDRLERVLRTITVSEALKSLTPAHREAIVETFLRDRTVNEAAEVLDIPVGTVKSRIYYGLRALRAVLEESGETVP